MRFTFTFYIGRKTVTFESGQPLVAVPFSVIIICYFRYKVNYCRVSPLDLSGFC